MNTNSTIHKLFDSRSRQSKTFVFTEDQFNKEKEAIYHEGFESGRKDANLEATQRQETLQRELLYNLQTNLDKSIDEQKNIQNKVSDLVLNLAVALFKKTYPTFSVVAGLDEIVNFIDSQLSCLKDLPELTITVHPDRVETIERACKKIKAEKGLKLEIFVKGLAKFEPTDCQIKWQNGYVEKCLEQVINDISSLMFDLNNSKNNVQEG
jgi:flagellar biosynthesis/type III secretory pathway protein FliH